MSAANAAYTKYAQYVNVAIRAGYVIYQPMPREEIASVLLGDSTADASYAALYKSPSFIAPVYPGGYLIPSEFVVNNVLAASAASAESGVSDPSPAAPAAAYASSAASVISAAYAMYYALAAYNASTSSFNSALSAVSEVTTASS